MSKDHQANARIRHLFDRAGFGATPAEITEAARMPIRKVVRALLKDSEKVDPFAVIDADEFSPKKQLKNMAQNGMIDRESLKKRIRENAELVRDLNVVWLDQMASGKAALREKIGAVLAWAFCLPGTGPKRARDATVRQRDPGKCAW